MSNSRMQQIITLLYGHTVIVTSSGVHSKAADLLRALRERILKHIDYYEGNEMVAADLKFLCLVINEWF